MELKCRNRVKNKEHYEYYKSNAKTPVSKEVYESFLYGSGESLFDWRTKVPCKEFGLIHEIMHNVVTKGYIMQLPHGLGEIYINKKKPKVYEVNGKLYRKNAINWQALKKEGKVIFYENRHSDEYIYRIKWFPRYPFKNKTLYLFKPSRGFRRYIAFMKSNNPQIDYLEDV